MIKEGDHVRIIHCSASGQVLNFFYGPDGRKMAHIKLDKEFTGRVENKKCDIFISHIVADAENLKLKERANSCEFL